jgi:rubrerythrin
MGIDMDFGKLSPTDVLDLAIYAEQEAQEYYERIASWMGRAGNAPAEEFFRTMAAREVQHRDQLAALRHSLFADKPTTLSNVTAWGIELPDDSRMPTSLREAMTIALDSETRAYEYYTRALEFTTESQTAELFERLRQAELGHQKLIQIEMAKLPS